MGAMKFAGPFAFALAIPLLYRWNPSAPSIVPAAILLTLLIAERVSMKAMEHTRSATFRWLPILYVPLQLGITLWAMREAAVTTSAVAFMALTLSTGVCTGVFGVLAAHELVHSRMRWHQAVGTAMLYGMSYPHFRIAHIHSHHRHAATIRDASTARLGETFYEFLPRTLVQQFADAWTFERRRCAAQRIPLHRNRMVRDGTILILLYVAVAATLGWRAGALLAAESVVGIMVLELFNYVAHYGLVRRIVGGRPERFRNRHSWSSSGAGNLLIFNMGHHTHHHQAPSISYEGLQPDDSPELPLGYSGSIIVALIPPVWRSVMDGRAKRWSGDSAGIGYAPASRPAAALL